MKPLWVILLLLLNFKLLVYGQDFLNSTQIDNLQFDRGLKAQRVTITSGTVQDLRYTVKPSTATIKHFTTSTTYNVPYPINGFSIVCFGQGATISSNVGDINNVPFIDGLGVSIQLDQPKYNANFKFVLQPDTTVYLTMR